MGQGQGIQEAGPMLKRRCGPSLSTVDKSGYLFDINGLPAGVYQAVTRAAVRSARIGKGLGHKAVGVGGKVGVEPEVRGVP